MKIRFSVVIALLFICCYPGSDGPGLTARAEKNEFRLNTPTEEEKFKSPGPPPTVEQILDRYVQAIGGAAAWSKLTSRLTKATFEIQGSKVTGSLDLYAQAPNKQVQIGRIKVDGKDADFETSTGFNGEVGWSLNLTEGGFRELEDDELAAQKLFAEFYLNIKLKEIYPKLALLAPMEIGNQTIYRIEATPREGASIRLYFGAQTGLLVRVDSTLESLNKRKVPYTTYYEGYREVDGVKLPFTIRQNKIILRVNEVKHNVPIDKALFENPGAAFEALSRFKARRTGPPVAEHGALYLTLEPDGAQISLRAELDGRNQSYTIADRTEITRRMQELYLQLYQMRGAKAELKPVLEELGATFFTPITSLLEEAAEIRFIIPGKYLRFPLDLLHFKGRPLFLQKPVTYGFEKLEAGPVAFTAPRPALMIEDEGLNSEKCCQWLNNALPLSDYYSSGEMNLAKLASQPPADLLLVSAHGYVGYGRTDYLQLGEERIQPEHLVHLAPKLVFMDSCTMGASASFIQSFRERGARYYVASLAGVEAGNSSTKIIRNFFERLKAGDTPSRALFFTRKKMYEVYGEKEGYAKLLNRSFPFRVYVLN